VAISVQTWAQARTSAVRAAILYSLEPLFAGAFSVVMGYETLGVREWGGGGLIVLGVLVSEVGSGLWGRWRGQGAPQGGGAG
jgi:drug/metabolite transporter (DMT)-like permease